MISDRRIWKDSAARSLQSASQDPKKWILIHTGVVLVAALIMMVVDYLLEQGIGDTGGLGGIGVRSVLTTAQSVMHYAQVLLLPFWQMGYTFCCLQLARGNEVRPRSLTEGFRRFGPVLRLMLLQWALYMAIAMICVYISSFIFTMLPFSASMMEALEAAMTTGELTEEALMQIMEDAYVPILITFSVVFIPVVLPFFYKYRMAAYCLLDDPKMGALAALRESSRMMRGNRLTLAKLDVSFWWFYLLDILVSAISYGDLLLPLVGVRLPWPEDANYFLFFIPYALCQLALYWWRRNEVEVTYAHVYLSWQEPPQALSQQ